MTPEPQENFGAYAGPMTLAALALLMLGGFAWAGPGAGLALLGAGLLFLLGVDALKR